MNEQNRNHGQKVLLNLLDESEEAKSQIHALLNLLYDSLLRIKSWLASRLQFLLRQSTFSVLRTSPRIQSLGTCLLCWLHLLEISQNLL